MNQIRVKIVVPAADQALAWYAEALEAEVLDRHEMDGAVVYSELVAADTTLTLKDADAHDPPTEHLILDVRLDDPDPLWDRMVAAGATVVFPIDDQFYGMRGGRVRDPFGVQWILSGPLRGDRDGS